MNVRRVYIPPKFIVRGIDPARGGIGAHHECWAHGGVTTAGADATHHPTIFQNSGGSFYTKF